MTFSVLLAVCGSVVYSYVAGDNHHHSVQQAHYTYSVNDRNPAFADVRIELIGKRIESPVLRMPRWTPGAYRIREFADQVDKFRASGEAEAALPFERPDESGWRISGTADTLVVEYEVEYAYQSWSAGVEHNYVLVEGPSTFMYVDGQQNHPVTVSYRVPGGWEVVSPLERVDARTFVAADFHHLVDAPAQLGELFQRTFSLDDARVDLVFHGDAQFDTSGFVAMVEEICRYQTSFFEEIPFKRFVFFYRLLPGRRGGGGLEHANSTTIGLSAARLSENILSAAEVSAHEFFHVWNVKRIKPSAYSVLDYDRKVRINSLWFVEGVTSYYEALTVLRTGLWSPDEFFNEMEDQIATLELARQSERVSVEDVSWSIWERGYGFPGVSFYNQGEVAGLLLDLLIRDASQNETSLDDVMRELNDEFGKTGKGFEPGDILTAVNSAGSSDFGDFFEACVSGTDPMPYETALAAAGLRLDMNVLRKPDAGDLAFVGPRNRVVNVEHTSPLDRAGVKLNDYLVAVDGEPVNSFSQWLRCIRAHEIDDILVLEIERDSRPLALPVKLESKNLVECEIEPLPQTTDLQNEIRDGWLEGWTRQNQRRSGSTDNN